MNTGNVLSNVQEKTSEVSGRAWAAMERGGRQVREMTGQLMGRSKDLARSMDHCVHDHTWMALGVAAAVGIIVGLAIGRR